MGLPQPSAAHSGSVPQTLTPMPGLLPSTQDGAALPGRKIVSPGGWGTPACTGRSHQGGTVLPAQHSPGLRSAPSGSICARIHSDGRGRWDPTAQLCRGLCRWGTCPLPAAWPRAPALHPGCALQPPAGPTSRLPGQGHMQHQAPPQEPHQAPHHGELVRTHTPVPLARAMVLPEHPCLAWLQSSPWNGDPHTPRWRES